MFERFTDRARQVLVLAQDEARALRHKYIGTEHFLLALLREDERLAAPVLGSCGITLAEVRAQVIRVVGEGTEPTPEQIPFTKHAVNVTNLAQQEARSLDNEFIGTEHVLTRPRQRARGPRSGDPRRVGRGRGEDPRGDHPNDRGPGSRQTDEGFPPGQEH